MTKYQTFSGSAIAVTLIAVAAMVTITLGVAQLVPKDFRQSQAIESSLIAEAAAWAGIERTLLEIRRNPFYELSQEGLQGLRPYGAYVGNECITSRDLCAPGVDRLLGIPKNQTPVMFDVTNELATSPDVRYGVTAWHMVEQVGNIIANDMSDGLTDKSRTSSNINPILERDEVKILDATRLDSNEGLPAVTLRWAPIFHDEAYPGAGRCEASPGSKFLIAYSWLDGEGVVLHNADGVLADARGVIDFSTEPRKDIVRPSQGDAKRLSLRFLATTTTASDSSIADCFARYSLQTRGATSGEAVDMGFTVVESTGYSANVQRKVRVLVDRQNGKIVNILDFGVSCQTCSS